MNDLEIFMDKAADLISKAKLMDTLFSAGRGMATEGGRESCSDKRNKLLECDYCSVFDKAWTWDDHDKKWIDFHPIHDMDDIQLMKCILKHIHKFNAKGIYDIAAPKGALEKVFFIGKSVNAICLTRREIIKKLTCD